MKRVYYFMVLALIGFTLGAGIAYWQARSNAPETVAESADATPATDSATSTAADAALNAAADDVVAADAPALEIAATEMGVSEDATAETAPVAETADAEAQPAHGEHDHAAMMAAQDAAKNATPPVAGSTVGGAFELVDHNGNAVTHESWPGKYKLVFFGFTHCPDICPAALDRMTAALETLGDTAKDIQPLFITIDPARDDAATMKTYLANYHASIVGLTGSEAQIKQVEDTYKVYAAKVDTGTPVYTMAHSSFIFLMSPNDELLEIFRDTNPADEMVQKITARVAAQ